MAVRPSAAARARRSAVIWRRIRRRPPPTNGARPVYAAVVAWDRPVLPYQRCASVGSARVRPCQASEPRGRHGAAQPGHRRRRPCRPSRPGRRAVVAWPRSSTAGSGGGDRSPPGPCRARLATFPPLPPTASPAPSATPLAGETPLPSPSPIPGVDPLLGSDGRLTVLLMGTDYRPAHPGNRTDAIMVVSIDPTTGKSAAFSVPRDVADFPMPKSGQLRRPRSTGSTSISRPRWAMAARA